MMGMIELALDCNVDKQAREWLLTARQSGASLLRIVNDILDLSKIEAGKLYLEFAECDFHLYALAWFESLEGVMRVYVRELAPLFCTFG